MLDVMNASCGALVQDPSQLNALICPHVSELTTAVMPSRRVC